MGRLPFIHPLRLTFFFLLLVLSSWAQPVRFTSYDTEDGLSISRVRAILKDHQGFVWIGTPSGLNRFDGYQFEIYKKQLDNPLSLNHNAVLSLVEDSNQNFWVGTRGGLQLYDQSTATFFPDSGSEVPIFSAIQHITTLYLDRDQSLWVGSAKGLFRIKSEVPLPNAAAFKKAIANEQIQIDSSFNLNGTPPLKTRTYAWSFKEESTGRLWIGTNKGLICFDLNANRFVPIDLETQSPNHPIFNGPIQALEIDQQDRLWIGTEAGLFQLNPDRNQISRLSDLPEKDPFITELQLSPSGRMWIGTDGAGLFRYHPEEDRYEHYVHDILNPTSLQENNIEALHLSEDGTLWAGTHKGFSYFDPHQKPFYPYLPGEANGSISQGRVESISPSSNQALWLGIDDRGLNKMNLATGFFDKAQHRPSDPSTLKVNDVVSVLEDQKGRIWAATWGGGLSRIEPPVQVPLQRNQFTHFMMDPDVRVLLKDKYVWGLFEDRIGDVWIGTVESGVVHFNQATETYTYYESKPNSPNHLPDTWGKYVHEDYQNRIWIATNGVLCSMDRDGENFKQHPISCLQAQSSTVTIESDPSGNLWLGTQEGLVRYDPKTENCRIWKEKDGLLDIWVRTIEWDDKENMWLGTGRAICKFDPRAGTFTNYQTDDGLTAGEFTRASAKLPNGELVFGALSGIVRFHPDSIQVNETVPPVVLTDFRLFNESVPVRNAHSDTLDFPSPLLETIQNTKKLKLAHWQNALAFEFAALDYLNPKKNQYRYRLKGQDADWISSPSKSRFANYTNLSPGHYTFQVQGSNADGIWNEAGVELEITILFPWWQRWWAFGIYLLLAASLTMAVATIIRRRWRLQDQLRLEQIEATRLKELDALKSRLYTNLTHEFRTPLTVILGMVQQVREQPKNFLHKGTRLIESNGRNLLHLINQLLDLSKLENHSLELKEEQLDIVPHLGYLVSNFQSFANSKHIDLQFSSAQDSQFMDYDPEQVKQVMTNLLSNALKFTPSEGEVHIEIGPANGKLEVQVRDSGIGIPKADLPHIFDRFYQVDTIKSRVGEGTGIGLAHTRELVKLMGGQIQVESIVNQGTTFTLQLPIRNEKVKGEHQFGMVEPEESNTIESDVSNATISQNGASDNRPQILLIEDNPDVLIYLQSCLEPYYQIETAVNGQVGIDKAIKRIPDLIISDVMMPEKDGFQVCDTLKHDERTSHIPIILLTAKADSQSRIKGLKRGADAYLAKPFDKEELLVRLSMLLKRQEQLKQYFTRKYPAAKEVTIEPAEFKVAVEIEDAFIRKVREIVIAHYTDEDFSLPQLCQKLHMSRSQLFRKMKALINISPSQFIRHYRLDQGKLLLQQAEFNVSEVAWQVGFKDAAHFSKSYQERFGISPSETRR